jgi:hypothetical protein
MRGIEEMGMCRAEISGELVQSVVSNKDSGRDIQHAVFGIEILNCGAAAGRITFAKDLLKIAAQKLNNSVSHHSIPCRRRKRLRLLSGCKTTLRSLETLGSCDEGHIML